MTVREFRKRLDERRFEDMRAEVLAEKKKPAASERAVSKVRRKKA
jgi:hypothetical protein